MKNKSGFFEMAFWALNTAALIFVEYFFRTGNLSFSAEFFLLIKALLILYVLGIFMIYFALPHECGVRRALRICLASAVALLAVRLWFVLIP